MKTTNVLTGTKWSVDPTHSEILFKVRHMMIANVKGEFRKFTGEIFSESDDFKNASVSINIDASSVFTNEENRDNHLKSQDFFDVSAWPEITFEGTSFKKTAGQHYLLEGTLTIRGISKEISLDVEFGGINKDPWGNEKAGFSVSGSINRKDFGLNWNAALEAGGVLVSDEVKILAEVQLVKQA